MIVVKKFQVEAQENFHRKNGLMFGVKLVDGKVEVEDEHTSRLFKNIGYKVTEIEESESLTTSRNQALTKITKNKDKK